MVPKFLTEIPSLPWLVAVVAVFTCSCNNSSTSGWQEIDCKNRQRTSDDVGGYSAVSNSLGRDKASRAAVDYLWYYQCGKPPGPLVRPNAYFFDPAALPTRYRVLSYEEGFFRAPDSLMVQMKDGPRLLFCFSMQVVNCDRAKVCECPFDFNWEPELAP